MRDSPIGRSISRAALVLLCVASIAIVAVCRLALGPADLYEKDQPKTLAYTADVLLHGRWALPRDVIYQPATKPPLYNWIAAVVMKLSGSWSELAMKSPSVIGAFGVGILFLCVARLQWHGMPAHEDERHGLVVRATIGCVAVLAAAIWFSFGVDVRHASTIRLMFLARPDMLQAFFLTGAWLAATRALRLPFAPGEGWGEGAHGGENAVIREDAPRRAASDLEAPSALTLTLSRRERGPEAVAFWACFIGAVLTKGPLALLLLVYVPIAARVIGGSWRRVTALRPIIGLIATAIVVGAWLACAWHVDAQHVRSVMLGAEVIDRVTQQTPEGISKPVWYAAMWFESKGGPFAILATIAAACTLVGLWCKRRIDPVTLGASLWLIVLIAGLSLPAGKRMDYLLPTYAPAAWLAARLLIACCTRLSLPVALAGLVPLVMSYRVGHATLTTFVRDTKTGAAYSNRAVAFTREVRSRVGDEPLLVVVRGKNPLAVLLHRHQGSYLTADDLRTAKWVLLPTAQTTATPVLTSGELPMGFETLDERPPATIGLYRAGDVPIEVLIDAQRAVGTWTTQENPYHEAGTVWRE